MCEDGAEGVKKALRAWSIDIATNRLETSISIVYRVGSTLDNHWSLILHYGLCSV